MTMHFISFSVKIVSNNSDDYFLKCLLKSQLFLNQHCSLSMPSHNPVCAVRQISSFSSTYDSVYIKKQALPSLTTCLKVIRCDICCFKSYKKSQLLKAYCSQISNSRLHLFLNGYFYEKSAVSLCFKALTQCCSVSR